MPTIPNTRSIASGRDSDVHASTAISFLLGGPVGACSRSSKITAASRALANATSIPDSAPHANGAIPNRITGAITAAAAPAIFLTTW